MDLVLNDAGAAPLTRGALGSLLYHDIFDYPLTLPELIKWELGEKGGVPRGDISVGASEGFYFLAGRRGQVLKRLMKKRLSRKKFLIAQKAARTLKLIPTIEMIGVTGALAMENADEAADVDLLIITQKKALWLSRAIALVLLKLVGFPTRRYGDKNQKDKLCLNMWLDESALSWPKGDRNIYTAHEIAQIKPLYDRNESHARFLQKNRWLKDYWPNAVKIRRETIRGEGKPSVYGFLEPVARRLQLWYMRKKRSREIVGKNKAIFHPNDWWAIVSARLPLDSP